MDLETIGEHLHKYIQDEHDISTTFFAVLDECSISEDTALLAQYKDGKVDTVRCHFDTVNMELIRMDVITMNIAETQDLAKSMESGVFRSVPPVQNEQNTTAAEAPKRIPGRRYFETEDGDSVMLLSTAEGEKFEGTQMFSKGKFKKMVRELPNSETRL